MIDPKQKSYQEHLERFKMHVGHFEEIDELLEKFSNKYGFMLEKNQWHRPCRVLRRKGNPEYVIEISQEGDWKKADFRNELGTKFIIRTCVDRLADDGRTTVARYG